MLKCILAVGLLAGCGSSGVPPPVAATQPAAGQKTPTATEVFNLRQKCFELGEKIDKDMFHGSTVTQYAISNYSVENNRCYVKLVTSSPTALSMERLFDGQTKEELASAQLGSKLFNRVGDADASYEEAEAYINKLMEREGEKQ